MKRFKQIILPLTIGILLIGLGRPWRFIDAPNAIATGGNRVSGAQSEHWLVVPDSVYDGDTLRVTRGERELKIRLCGIDAPELEQPKGIESRDHLRSLIKKGDASIIVMPVEKDRYGRTVAELYIEPRPGQGYQPEEEIFLNGEMVMSGMAYVYEKYVDGCPNGSVIAMSEEMAKGSQVGVWDGGEYQRPWDWRRAK